MSTKMMGLSTEDLHHLQQFPDVLLRNLNILCHHHLDIDLTGSGSILFAHLERNMSNAVQYTKNPFASMHRGHKAFVQTKYDTRFAMKSLVNMLPELRLSAKRLLMTMLEQQVSDLTQWDMKFLGKRRVNTLLHEFELCVKRFLATMLPDLEASVRTRWDTKFSRIVNMLRLQWCAKNRREIMLEQEVYDQMLSGMKFQGIMLAGCRVFSLRRHQESMLRAFAQRLDGRWYHSLNGSSASDLLILWIAESRCLLLKGRDTTRKCLDRDQLRLLSLNDLELGNHLCLCTQTMWGGRCTDRGGV
jgi:hypothetical protein